MDKSKNESENLEMEIKGFDVELQGLSHVAGEYAKFNTNDPQTPKEIVEITQLARKYLKYVFIKAIERYGEDITNEKD